MPAAVISRVRGLNVMIGRYRTVPMDGMYVTFPFDNAVRGALRQEFARAHFDTRMSRWVIPGVEYDHIVRFFSERGYVVIDGRQVISQPVTSGEKR